MEFLDQFQNKDEILHLWPLLEKEFCKPLVEQNLDTFYVLLNIKKKFPDLFSKPVMKKYFGSGKIINKETLPDVIKVLNVSLCI